MVTFIPVNSSPFEHLAQFLDSAFDSSRLHRQRHSSRIWTDRIGILDSENELATVTLCKQVIEQRCSEASKMQRSCGAGSKSRSDGLRDEGIWPWVVWSHCCHAPSAKGNGCVLPFRMYQPLSIQDIPHLKCSCPIREPRPEICLVDKKKIGDS